MGKQLLHRAITLLAGVFLFSCGQQPPVKTEPKVKLKVSKKEVVPELKPKPIYVPPEVVRVMIMPYEDDQGVLHQGSFLYFTLKPGYWTIATNSFHKRVKKMVSIVRTQSELSTVNQPIENVKLPPPKTVIIKSPKPNPESSCGPNCMRKLSAIKKFTERK